MENINLLTSHLTPDIQYYTYVPIFVFYLDAMESHHKFGDHEAKDTNESSNQEVLGCWTEIEPNAPESSEAKVYVYVLHTYTVKYHK